MSAGYCDSPTTATVTVSDASPSAQPEVTFSYTVNNYARVAHDVLFWAFAPTGFTLTTLTGAQVAAQAVVKIDGVTKSPGIVWTDNSQVGSSLLLINLNDGYTLSIGDEVEVTFPAGIVTNPSTTGGVTWVWRTSTASGYDEECYTKTFSIAPTTTTTEPATTTTEPETTTTESPTTTEALATTTTVGTSTSVLGGSTTVPTTGTTIAGSFGTDGAPTLTGSGAPGDGGLTSAGARSGLLMLLAAVLMLIGTVALRAEQRRAG